MGNLKDAMLVKLADKGNGNYGYIDTLLEAKKLLVDQLSGTLVTIAKDVKIQVEFNPRASLRLPAHRLRKAAAREGGFQRRQEGRRRNRRGPHRDRALRSRARRQRPAGWPAQVDALKYQPMPAAEKSEILNPQIEISPELLTLKLRYKAPDGDTSKLLEFPLTDTGAALEKSTRDFRFAAAVAGYGMLLRDSQFKGNATWASVQELAVEGKGEDTHGHRAEFITLIEKARSLMR